MEEDTSEDDDTLTCHGCNQDSENFSTVVIIQNQLRSFSNQLVLLVMKRGVRAFWAKVDIGFYARLAVHIIIYFILASFFH